MPDTSQHIDYTKLMRQALAGLIPLVLAQVAKTGLPGGHHFYISFATDAKGVKMPNHLRKAHPQEMTIVLQHKFEDLRVLEDRFSVRLFFSGVAADLEVPFASLYAFIDPHAGFRLQLAQPPVQKGDQAPKPTKKQDKKGELVDLAAFRGKSEKDDE